MRIDYILKAAAKPYKPRQAAKVLGQAHDGHLYGVCR